MGGEENSNSFFLFVSIPHSGIQVPPEAVWLKKAPSSVLMCDVDAFVDDLYGPALKEFCIPSVVFKWHRYAVDANRFSTDISPLTVEGSKPLLQIKDDSKKDQKKSKSPSDIHWHKTTKGDLLIQKALPKKLHEVLIKKYFDPFHKKIQKQIMNFKQSGNNTVYLLDLHSMPSQGLDFHRDPGESRKDIVISDHGGQSCSEAFKNLVAAAYKTAGFEVAFNWPYKGGAVTRHYGQPEKGQEVLQVELNRKLYMDEKSKKKISNYRQVQAQLKQAIAFIVKNQKKFLRDKYTDRV